MFRASRILSNRRNRRNHTGRRGRSLILGTLLVVFLVPAVGAEDTRPSEIPYDTGDAIPVLDPSYRQKTHEVVLITDNDLRPQIVQLGEGQLVAWISYAKAPSRIVFEREVARSMICHSLINFSIVEDELRSADIHPGEFASFCELKPGRYRYKVVRPDPNMAGNMGGQRRLDGVIVVGDSSQAK